VLCLTALSAVTDAYNHSTKFYFHCSISLTIT